MTRHEPIAGLVLDEKVTLSLSEVCEVCGVEAAVVIEMVAEGVAAPIETEAAELEFTGLAVTRLLTAWRLQRDLHVNLAGAALALELLDEIEHMRLRDEP